LAKARVRYGYFRIDILLRRDGRMDNHKRVYRLYREDGLSLRLKRPRRQSAQPPGAPAGGNQAERALVDGFRLQITSCAAHSINFDSRSESSGSRITSPVFKVPIYLSQNEDVALISVSSELPASRRRRATAVVEVINRKNRQDILA